MKLSAFDFSLPKRLIAQNPSRIRDRSRLMIVDRRSKTIEEREFRDIIEYLNPEDLMLLNNTKVFPARLFGEKRDTGGKVEALLVNQLDEANWVCLVKGKVKIGQDLVFAKKNLFGRIIADEGAGRWRIHFRWDGDFYDLLHRYGQLPLPPYIKRGSPLPEDLRRYQTVFAQHSGAVAAPTAGLHFTDDLIKKIRKQGIEIAFITLHVGPGTFKPIRTEDITEHRMDKESYSVDPEVIEKISRAKNIGKRVIAVGTTTTRVLETIYKNKASSESRLQGWTDLYITPGYTFKAVDVLITNFHLPRSTLLILVCSFAGYDLIMKAYRLAIERGFRFYSYGDAMFIK